MKKSIVFIVAFCSWMNLQAQHRVNSFFDDMGLVRLETQELLEASDSVATIFHRADDVVFSRIVYRIIDLREKQNMQLYTPVSTDDPRYRSLFKVILDGIIDGMPVYEKSSNTGDIKPYFNHEPLDRASIPTVLNTDRDGNLSDGDIATSNYMLLNYDSITNKMTFKNYSYYDFAKNQLKYMIQEIIFFDRHYSRLYSKIIGIAPMQLDNVQYYDGMPLMDALYGQLLFWIPFDYLRPYLANQYITPRQNDTKRVTFDDFFALKMYSSYLVGESNMYDRMIPAYCTTAEEIRKEQQRIEWELLSAEQDLWEY